VRQHLLSAVEPGKAPVGQGEQSDLGDIHPRRHRSVHSRQIAAKD
jgi:hypothetical protein